MICWRCQGRTCHGRVKRRKAGKCSSSTQIRSGSSGQRARWRPIEVHLVGARHDEQLVEPSRRPVVRQGAEQQVQTRQVVAVVPAADLQWQQGAEPSGPDSVTPCFWLRGGAAAVHAPACRWCLSRRSPPGPRSGLAYPCPWARRSCRPLCGSGEPLGPRCAAVRFATAPSIGSCLSSRPRTPARPSVRVLPSSAPHPGTQRLGRRDDHEQQDRAQREHPDERPQRARHLLLGLVGGHDALRLDPVPAAPHPETPASGRARESSAAPTSSAVSMAVLGRRAHAGDLHDQARIAELVARAPPCNGDPRPAPPMPCAPTRCSGCSPAGRRPPTGR